MVKLHSFIKVSTLHDLMTITLDGRKPMQWTEDLLCDHLGKDHSPCSCLRYRCRTLGRRGSMRPALTMCRKPHDGAHECLPLLHNQCISAVVTADSLLQWLSNCCSSASRCSQDKITISQLSNDIRVHAEQCLERVGFPVYGILSVL